MRAFLKELRDKGIISKEDYRVLYAKVKGGFFRSKRHIKLYIADQGNHNIRRVSEGVITTYAGCGPCLDIGDGGPATEASLYNPRGVAFDEAGHLYSADTFNNRIRRVDRNTETISTVAGDGQPCFRSDVPCGDGGPAVSASLARPARSKRLAGPTRAPRARGASGRVVPVRGGGAARASGPLRALV